MGNNLNKYFADEFTPEEKDKFLTKINRNEELREEFIENQQVMAYISLLDRSDDRQFAQQKLNEFMRKMESAKNN